MEIEKTYHGLMKKYGHQGWWPLQGIQGTNPTKTGSVQGYHPGDYTFPKDKQQEFEICVGAILMRDNH